MLSSASPGSGPEWPSAEELQNNYTKKPPASIVALLATDMTQSVTVPVPATKAFLSPLLPAAYVGPWDSPLVIFTHIKLDDHTEG